MSESIQDDVPKDISISTKRSGFSRKSFLKVAGASAIAATTFGLAGCEDEDDITGEDMVNLGSGDVGVLNYAYALEQLEAAFYDRVVTDSVYDGNDDGNAKGGTISAHVGILQDIRDHEVAHADFYRAALGDGAIPALTPNFDSIDFEDETSLLNAALTFENTGVSAYNGAGQLLENPDFLLVAGKIVSVEARHAAIISNLTNPNAGVYTDDITDANGLDGALSPQQVLTAIDPFIEETIDASGLPQAQ